jgi:hypothetical protein
VREIISHLDAEGHVDGKRLRLTMTGLILAASMQGATLRPVRHVPAVGAQAKVA